MAKYLLMLIIVATFLITVISFNIVSNHAICYHLKSKKGHFREFSLKRLEGRKYL